MPSSRPDHFALRCIVLGGLASMLWLRWQHHSWSESAQVWTWSLPLQTEGTSALHALPALCLHTFAFVLVAMLVSAASGILVAFTLVRLCAWRACVGLITLIGQALAALPVIGLAWCGIGWLVTEAKLPIESLIPYIPPPERDSRALEFGRFVWSWIVPMWALVVPLTGLWLSAAADAFRSTWPLAFADGLKARGVTRSVRTWQHWFKLAWATMQHRWHCFALLAFAYAVIIEDVFGLPGWGGFVMRARHQHAVLDLAAAMNAVAWMTALWHVLSWPLRSVVAVDELPQAHRSWWRLLVMMIALAVAIGLGPATWLQELLAPHVPEVLRPHWVSLLDDLHGAGVVAAWAALWALIIGGWAASVAMLRARFRPRVLDLLVGSPLLAWMLIAIKESNAEQWLAIVLALPGAVLLRDSFTMLRLAPHVQASRVLGNSVLGRWWQHMLPELGTALSVWTVQTIGTALLWTVLIRSLPGFESPVSLGAEFANARNTVLGNVWSVGDPTWVTAAAVLCFWRLSRLLRPASH